MATYWRRVRYEADDPPWELRYHEHGGFFAIASRDFAPGDLICTEFPIIWIEGHHPFNQSQVDEIVTKVDNLQSEDKEAYYAMANVFKEDEYHPAVGIFMTNCFDMTDSIYGTCSAMYLALARLNHSCLPNAQQTHLPETTEEVLYASRVIKKGEEINDCYIELRQNYSQRQRELSEHYRFQCLCAGCTGLYQSQLLSNDDVDLLRQEDDKMRSRAYSIIDDLTTLIEQDRIEEAYHSAQQMLKQMSKKEYLGWSVRYLPELFLCLKDMASSLLNRSAAKKYLEKGHKLNLLLTGPRSEYTKRTKELLKGES